MTLGGGFRKDGPSPPKRLTAETVGSSLRERPTLMIIHKLRGFPGGSDSEEPTCSAEDPGSILGQEDPLEEEMATTLVFLPGKCHGQRSLAGYGPCSHKESDTTINIKSYQMFPEKVHYQR